jgi:hypothetical protein
MGKLQFVVSFVGPAAKGNGGKTCGGFAGVRRIAAEKTSGCAVVYRSKPGET